MEDNNNIIITIEKWEDVKTEILKLKELNNNEVLIFLEWILDHQYNMLFDSNIDIFYRFNFVNINAEIFFLLLIINWLQKYKPKSINLTLPYLPYTENDYSVYSEQQSVKLHTHYWFLNLLDKSWVSYITTYDMWNPQLASYSTMYIKNIRKDKIFNDEFSFFKNSRKALFIMALNEDDYNLLYSKFSEKPNIKLLNVSSFINFQSKKEVLTLLKPFINNENIPLYIFDKDIKTGTKMANICKLLLKEAKLKEINICITHALFSNWSYRKFNTLIDWYWGKVNITLTTTDSVNGYAENIKEDNLQILQL